VVRADPELRREVESLLAQDSSKRMRWINRHELR
jgi:hypothetical protein